MTNFLFTDHAEYCFSAVYHCGICSEVSDLPLKSYSFHTWFEHIISHFIHSYSQILVNFSQSSIHDLFPLVPSITTFAPFLFKISIAVHGEQSSYAEIASFSSITSDERLFLHFESVADNLFSNAVDGNLIAKPKVSPVIIYYTVDFLSYGPVPDTNSFKKFELLTIPSDKSKEILFYSQLSFVQICSIFSKNIFSAVEFFLTQLISFNSNYKETLDRLKSRDSDKSVSLSLGHNSKLALKMYRTKKDSFVLLTESSYRRDFKSDHLNLGIFLYDSAQFLSSKTISTSTRNQYHFLLTIFYYLQTPNHVDRGILFTPRVTSIDPAKKLLLDRSQNLNFFKSDSEEIQRSTVNFIGSFRCSLCKNSFHTYKSFFKHVRHHIFSSYSGLISLYDDPDFIPLTVDSDKFRMFAFKFTPIDYSYSDFKFDSQFFKIDFSSVFKEFYYDDIFKSETYHLISTRDDKADKNNRSSFNYSVEFVKHDSVRHRFNNDDFVDFPVSHATNNFPHEFTLHDLHVFIEHNSQDIFDNLTYAINYLSSAIRSLHGNAVSHYALEIVDYISDHNKILIDFTNSAHFSLLFDFKSDSNSIAIIHTPIDFTGLRFSFEDFMYDLLIVDFTSDDFNAYLLMTLYYFICLITIPPPIISPSIEELDDSDSEEVDNYEVPSPEFVSPDSVVPLNDKINIEDVPTPDQYLKDSTSDDGILSEDEFNNLTNYIDLDNLKDTVLKTKDDELSKLSLFFKLYDPDTKLTDTDKRPKIKSYRRLSLDQIYSLLQYHYFLLPADPTNHFLNDNVPDGKKFILKKLLIIITHQYFSSSVLHRLICRTTIYPNGVRVSSDVCTNFSSQDEVDAFKNKYGQFINFDVLTSDKMQFVKAIFYYFAPILFYRQLNEYYYYLSINPSNNPVPDLTPYSSRAYKRFIIGKVFYRCAVGKRIFIKELKKIDCLPHPNASDSQRLSNNRKLIEIRAILNDNRDILSSVLHDLYTDSDNFFTIIPGIINQSTLNTDKLYFKRDKLTLILFLYFIDKTVSDPQKRSSYFKFIHDLIFKSGSSSKTIKGNLVDAFDNKTFDNPPPSTYTNIDSYFSYVLPQLRDLKIALYKVLNNENDEIDADKYNNIYKLLTSKKLNVLIPGINSLKTFMIEHPKFSDLKKDKYYNEYKTQFLFKVNVAYLNLTDTIDKTVFNLKNSYKDNPYQHHVSLPIEQTNFDLLLDRHLNTLFPAPDFPDHKNTTKVVFASIISRTVRSDIPKRLLTFFLIREFFNQPSAVHYDFLLQLLRNKMISKDFNSNIINTLSTVLLPYITSPNFLDLDELVKNKGDAFSFAGQFYHEFDQFIPISLGLIRHKADSLFLTNLQVQNFFSHIRVRNAGRNRKGNPTFFPLGDSRSRQRLRVRSFLYLTSNEFDTQTCPNINLLYPQFFNIHNLIATNLISSQQQALPSYLSHPNSISLTAIPHLDQITLQLDPDAIFTLADVSYPDIHYINADYYFKQLAIVRSHFKDEISFKASFTTYPISILSILDNIALDLKITPIQRLGNIPVIRRSLFEMNSSSRITGEAFSFSIDEQTHNSFRYQYLLNNTNNSTTIDTITLQFKPFNDQSVSYSVNFNNWVNKKINLLDNQLNILDSQSDNAYRFDMTKISNDSSHQHIFTRTMKSRQRDYYIACNRAITNYIIRNKISNEEHVKNINYSLTKKDLKKYKDELEKIKKDDKLIKKDKTEKIKKLENNINRLKKSSRLNFGPWSFDARAPDNDTLQSIFSANNIATGDTLSLNTRSMDSLLDILNTSYEKDIHQKIEIIRKNFDDNNENENDNRTAFTRIAHNFAKDTQIENNVNNYLDTIHSNPKLLSDGLIPILQKDFVTLIRNAFDHPNNLDQTYIPGNIHSITDNSFKKYCSEIFSQYFLVALANKIIETTDPNTICLDDLTITEFLNGFPDVFKKILIGLSIAQLPSVTRNDYYQHSFELSLIVLDNVFVLKIKSILNYTTTSVALYADKRLGSTKVFLKITFPVPPINSVLSKDYSSIMGIDLGRRTFASAAIRSTGIGCNRGNPHINPEDIWKSTVFKAPDQGLSNAQDHGIRSRSLNAQSRFLQRARHKFSVYSESHGHPLSKLDFSDNNHRFFHVFNLSRNISSVQLKKQSINHSVVHKTSTDILHLGLSFGVNKFVFEDLSGLQKYFQTLGGRGRGSYYFSSNLFGQLVNSVKYKSLKFGYHDKASSFVILVDPDFTSRMCPFSVAQNNKLLENNKDKTRNKRKFQVHSSCVTGKLSDTGNFTHWKSGKFFLHDPSPHDAHNPMKKIFADRDFVASFNLTYCK